MKKKTLAILLALFTIGTVTLTGCAQKTTKESATMQSSSTQNSNTATKAAVTSAIPSKIAGKQLKIMVVRKIGGDDHTAQFLAGTKQEGESYGITVDTFTANGDSAKFHDAINQALEKNYDGFIISHGDDVATVDDVKKITAKGIPVVTFDSNADISKISGVTLTSQDDEALALLSLKKLIQDKDGKANIIYLWVDGFPPMVNRNREYKAMLEKYPGLKEVERFGVASSDTSVQTQNAVAAMLAKHPKGTIDAIFASWDAFAIGAQRAVKEAGRSEIKIYGIDVSNADLQAIQQKGSSWVSTSAVDPKLIGAVDLRILLKKIAGEDTPKYYDLEAALITQEKLNNAGTTVNMQNLSKIIPGWGTTTAFQEPWMNTLKQNKFKK
ncbi:sugar ABC transporter substrate-binding protein [Clostridium estertheticum]|uniref:Sugar ABC transporter substrate-binding protein n=1 Tax=Clostridium estertheticum TaxID=238834 RepID=A0AA47I7W6_9CLOT|nr:sugar ABC transporter substrate-binding protein [Clostridium estertheticum]MBU3154548.1 sugar ABC transporter substrate-binding protein [Clostridium estertheticum]MBU3201238.1 sugar ABC transporter substrate-binding protein [Clostridium estertheticum]WAG62018.1 sugar ABC transporter substrate-binding protein [Clostridium estertheticum]WAG63858.1 sugar ABC transporter substrate-binding protein [Clostridium estertheticum]